MENERKFTVRSKKAVMLTTSSQKNYHKVKNHFTLKKGTQQMSDERVNKAK